MKRSAQRRDDVPAVGQNEVAYIISIRLCTTVMFLLRFLTNSYSVIRCRYTCDVAYVISMRLCTTAMFLLRFPTTSTPVPSHLPNSGGGYLWYYCPTFPVTGILILFGNSTFLQVLNNCFEKFNTPISLNAAMLGSHLSAQGHKEHTNHQPMSEILVSHNAYSKQG